MEQKQTADGLNMPLPDQETFDRVWRRVMPDQEHSPVAVNAPEPSASAPAQAQPEEEPSAQTGEKETSSPDETLLQGLMELAQEGMGGAQAIFRRTGSRTRQLSDLAADHRRALRQLATLYFLLTGRRFRPKAAAPVRGGELPAALREQFLWERDWVRACLEGAERAQDRALQELCQELAQDGALHGRAIRAMLERME